MDDSAVNGLPQEQPHRPFSTISAKLKGLVALMALPCVLLSVFSGYAVFRAEKDAAVHAATQTSQALAAVVEREMAVRAALLTGLAASPTLRTGELGAFWREAKDVKRDPSDAIVLFDASGRQIMNTAVAWGATLPQQNPFRTNETSAVSDLHRSATGNAIFAVRVPVDVRGEAMSLALVSSASQLQALFKEQPLPAGWMGTVLDSQGQVAARTQDSERRVGQRISEPTRRAIMANGRGVVEANNLDGRPVFGVFTKSPGNDWSVLVSLYRSRLAQGAWAAFASTLVLSFTFALFLLWVARRITQSVLTPLRQLTVHARELGEGITVAPSSSGVPEIDTVQAALAKASKERQEADQRMKREVDAAVSSSRAAQEAVLRSQKLEALGRLTGGIAHDFNNLLQTMTTGLQLARRLSHDKRADAALDACQRASARAAQLTRQLLSVGRRQAGHEVVLNVAQELADLAPLLRGAAGSAIDLQLQVQEGIGCVRIDPVHLEMALLNLVLNSRDAIAGRGTICVKGRMQGLDIDRPGLRAGPYVVISVKDDGQGMSPELLSRVFEPFFTTKPVGKGTGLGLAQVYSFATQAGGSVMLESAPGQGTQVDIWLPQTAEVAAPPDAPRASPPEPAPSAQSASGVVLLVEDDSLVSEVTASALSQRGFTVVTMPTADAALEHLQGGSAVDVVLSDIVMPGTRSGVDLARTLAVLRPTLPVILASGHPMRVEGAPDIVFVPKPYDVDYIAKRLMAAISGRRPGADSGFNELDGPRAED
ncbi:ATP-binding protein [Roseateles sp.]|uniref:ATP-binding protein n=1 Tax=Roseateles sp. TaxID=1971397 RepID=UPI0031DF977D